MNRTGLQRDTIDKFYTNLNIASQCIRWFSENINIENTDVIIEPSAGNGSFIDGLRNISNNCLFYDIEPEHPDVVKQDFLNYSALNIKRVDPNTKIHVVGNPPFGRQSTLAIRFIKNACSFANTISFILPNSFKKDSMRNKIPRQFHLVFEHELPENSFSVDGNDVNVPCVFQIWKKQENNRAIRPYSLSRFVDFVKLDDNPDFSIRRVGVYAGKLDSDINKSVQSHYFIKMKNNIDPNLFGEEFLTIEFTHDNTAGPKSISKKELIIELNRLSL